MGLSALGLFSSLHFPLAPRSGERVGVRGESSPSGKRVRVSSEEKSERGALSPSFLGGEGPGEGVP